MKKSLSNNAIYKAILNIFNLIVPILVTPYILSIPLKVEDFDMYNRVYNEFQVFFLLAAFGIYTYGMREISKVRDDQAKVNKLFSSLFVIGVITNIVMILIYFFYASTRATGLDYYVYLIFIIQLVSNIFYIEFINEAVENYGFITKKTIIVRIIYLLSIFALVKNPDDILIYTVIISATVLINNLVSYVYLQRYVKFDFHNLSICKHMAPLVIALILTNIEILYSQLDKVLLGFYVGDKAATFYTMPYTIVGMVCTLPLSLITVAIPRVSHLIGKQDMEGYKKILVNTINIFMSMLVPICFGIFVLSKEILDIYTHGIYTDAFQVLMIMALVRFGFGYQSILTNLIMYVNNLDKVLTKFLALFGVLNVAVDFLLIWMGYFTPETAIFSTGIIVVALDVAMYLYVRKELHLEIPLITKKTVCYFIVCLTFIPITYIISLFGFSLYVHVLFTVCACMGVYGMYLLYTRDEILFIFLRKFKLVK